MTALRCVVSFACPERPERPNQGTDWDHSGRAGRKEPNRVGVHCRADGIGRFVGPAGKLPVG